MRVDHVLPDLWHFHRRALLVCAALLGGMLILLVGVALFVRESGGAAPPHNRALAPASSPAVSQLAAPSPTAPATDVQSWDAIRAVVPATSPSYPPISAAARRDPTAFTRAFASELFTRAYAIGRQELISWAQYEDAPLRAANYPRADWSKVLVDSLTDLTWDDAVDTPIPAEGPWLARRAEHAVDVVSDVRVTLDQQWERLIANGYRPPDPLATARDVTLTVTRRTKVSGRVTKTRFELSLAVQLGTSPRGGYGVAATDNYVIKEAG